jgi:hypothetical protein
VHSPEHPTDGAVAVQLALQRAWQLAWHSPVQLTLPLCDVQALEQFPSHDALQSAVQSKLPGFAVQVPEQVALHVPSQLGRVAVQPPEQLASSCALQATCTFGAEHATSHDALAFTVHEAFPSTTAPPQSSKMLLAQAARAEWAANVIAAPATRARNEDQRTMMSLPGIEVIPVRRSRSTFLQVASDFATATYSHTG